MPESLPSLAVPLPPLVPAPRRLEPGAGALAVPSTLPLVLADWRHELLPVAAGLKQFAAERRSLQVELAAAAAGLHGSPHVLVVAGPVDHDQGYRLTVSPDRILIEAATPAGAAHGLATLKQLLPDAGGSLPALTAEDWPDIARRGFMLDISRGKVPSMETLYRLVDLMADLKLNELQLYTEHTFAYRDHRDVWLHYSPLTGEEILLLDRYCRERFIDLVPNQNSFGHLKEWLIHGRYRHLAEVQDGWWGWGIWFEGPWSLCPVEPASIPFLADLFDELLPHFSSRYFNVGCDETLDVGQGRSMEAVGRLGATRVYLDFLRQIYRLVQERGRTMMFWGDIILKSPELIAELPKDVIALEWGYEATHPFATDCAQFAASGVPFYVCPGTSTWNSFLGRTDNALANLLSAAENGVRHGASGYLITAWGDNGHQDYQPVLYLPLAYGAAVSWALAANREADVRAFLNRHIFADRAGGIGALLYDMGNLYQAVGYTPDNGSALAYLLLYAASPGFSALLPKPGAVSPADFDRAAAAIRECDSRLDGLALQCVDAALVERELRNGLRMLLHASDLGRILLEQQAGRQPDGGRVRALAHDLDEIMAEHWQLWLARNRVGGLEEMSLRPLRALRAWYDRQGAPV